LMAAQAGDLVEVVGTLTPHSLCGVIHVFR
jgi:hypothetical protein